MYKTLLLVLALASSPIYLFPSGLPQLADGIFAVFAAMVLSETLLSRKPLVASKPLFPMLLLGIWVLTVQLTWSFFVYDLPLRHPLYYFFNLTVIVSITQFLFYTANSERILLNGLRLSLIVSGIGIVLQLSAPGILGATETPYRITGFFNNPNQLAYFSLCCLASILALQQFKVDFRAVPLVAFCFGLIGAIIPTSLTAWGGLAFLFASILIANWRRLGQLSKLVLALPIIATLLLSLDLVTDGMLTDQIDSRITVFESKVDTIGEERQYERILAFPQYWIFGAGEGSNYRFKPFDGTEIHSSLGNIFFSYGAIGLCLLVLFFWRVMRNAPLAAWLLFAAPMFYGLTHMGLRTTMFWILMIVIWYKYSRNIHKPAESASAPTNPTAKRACVNEFQNGAVNGP